jgi:hypothetical protein
MINFYTKDFSLFNIKYDSKETGMTLQIPDLDDFKALPINKSDILKAEKECKAEAISFIRKCTDSYLNEKEGRLFEQSLPQHTYLIETQKNDISVEEVQKYCIRDGVQWMTLWTGWYQSPLWNCIAKIIGFTGSLDDLCVPFSDVEEGRYRIGNESLEEILSRLRELGKDRDERWLDFARDDIHLATRLQFFEKWATSKEPTSRCPQAINYIKRYTTEPNPLHASIFRNFDSMTAACLALVSYFYRFDFDDCDWAQFCASHIGCILGTDIGKEAVSIGVKCSTNFIYRHEYNEDENSLRFREICKLNHSLNSHFCEPNLRAMVYARYAHAALLFATLVDRYRERYTMRRLKMNGTLLTLVEKVIRCE